MFGGERRKTGGMSLGGRQSSAITPTKRYTDLGTHSVRKTDARPSLSVQSGQPRPSLFNNKNSTAAPRDVKSLQALNANKIWRFLVETDGVDAPVEGVVRSPRGKTDFIAIFESLYQHLSKDYEFPQPGRIEEEVMQIFEGIGYPFKLKNSFFQPMGASHGWPHLLDALAWLVDLIKINKNVNADTQNIIFGDFMEPAIAQEKTLSYAWFSTVFRDYTNDRKTAENMGTDFWEETKKKLRRYFEDSNEYEELMVNAQTALQQLRFDCDEIESERGQEQTYVEDIARMKDDIRKASEYFEFTQRVKELKEKELTAVKQELEARIAEQEMSQKTVNELKELIEDQKVTHGISGKEVRKMNLENSKDKEVVSELQAELDKVSKEMWRLKNYDSFKEQKLNFIQLATNVQKILAGTNIELGLEPLRTPNDEKQLKAGWENLSANWLPEVSRALQQKKLDLETEKSRFADKFAAAEERIQIEKEMLGQSKKKEAREERVRRNERDEWKEARQQMEKRYDELENKKEVLKNKMHMDGSLEKEIAAEKEKTTLIEKALEEKRQELEAEIRRKLDHISAEAAVIGNEKTMFHIEASETLKMVEQRCAVHQQ